MPAWGAEKKDEVRGRRISGASQATRSLRIPLQRLPIRARNERNPFLPSPDVLAEARAHFADHCAFRHANDGSGKTEIGQKTVKDLKVGDRVVIHATGPEDKLVASEVRFGSMPKEGMSGVDHTHP